MNAYVSHQLLLSAASNGNAAGTLSPTQNASTLPPTHGIGTRGLSTQDSTSDCRILDFDVGMTQSLAFVVQQDIDALDWLLKPGSDLTRGDILKRPIRYEYLRNT